MLYEGCSKILKQALIMHKKVKIVKKIGKFQI